MIKYNFYKSETAKLFKESIAHWTRIRRYVKRLPKSVCNRPDDENKGVQFFRDVNSYLATEHGEAMGGRYCAFCRANEICLTCPLVHHGLTEEECVDSPYSALIYADNKSTMLRLINKELQWLKNGRRKIYRKVRNDQVR